VNAHDLFWSRVSTDEEHWHYTHTLTAHGYGIFHHEGRSVLAHRFAYEDQVGPIPAGLEVDHLCAVRSCVRPAHLEPVTHAENLRRAGARKTHCPQGHPYSDENTRLYKRMRFCITCKREYDKRRYAASKAVSS